MLILTYRHNATRIAGFNAWKKRGRFVRKGETQPRTGNRPRWVVRDLIETRVLIADRGVQ